MQTLAIFGLTIVTATSAAAEETYIQKGNSLSEQGQHELAAAMYTAWIGSHIDDPQAYYSRGCCYYSLGQYAKAIADYNKALTLKTDDATLYNNRGSAYEKLGQFDKGIADFDRAIAIKPDYASAYNNRANCYRGLGQVEKAIADYDRAISRAPSSQIFYVNRGNYYTELGKVDKAISDFDKAISLKPDCVDAYYAYYNRGTLHSKRGQDDEAITDFDKAIALKSDYPIPYFSRGYSYSKREQFDKAISDYSRAIALKPDYAEAYCNRGDSYNDLGQFDKAIIDFDKTVALKPDCQGAYINRGNSYRATKQLDKAIADFTKAIALSPNDWLAYVHRGFSYQCLTQHEKAIADYDRVLGLKPEYAEAYTYRGSSYLALGQLDKALADFDKAIALKPDLQTAYIGRGEVLARQKKLTDSFQVFERAFPQNARNSYFYSSRAVAQFVSGDKSKGSADIEKALALAGEDAEAKQSANKIKNEFMEQSGTISATSASKDNKDRPIGDKWAVIVGVDNFADPTVPKLHYSKKDARDFYQYLTTKAGFKPDHVRLLLDEKATRERIWTEIGDVFLPHVVSPDDLVVLYFSTHGSPAEKDIRGSSYLIAYDTKKSRLYADGIEMPMLLASLQKRTGADRVLIVLDACHSGAADPGAKSADFQSSLDIDQIAVGRGNIIITSSQPDERSWESKHYANGIFTRRLIDSLTQNPNVIQGFDNLKDIVANEVRQEHGQHQTPRLKADGWEGRQLLLTAPATKSFPISDDVKKQLEPDSKTDVVSPTPLKK